MKLETFIRGLLPNFDKSRITGDLRNVKEELSEKTIPAFENAAELFGVGYKFVSPEGKQIDDLFMRATESRKKNVVLATLEALEKASDNTTRALELVEKHYNDEVVKVGMSYMNANILQYVSTLNYISETGRRLLLAVVAAETEGQNEKEAQRDIQFILNDLTNFVKVCNLHLKGHKKIEKELLSVPDLSIDPDMIEATTKAVGRRKLDPLGFGLISAKLNPIYHARMVLTQWRINRSKLAEQEIELINYKIENLRNLQRNQPDAAIEQQIDYYTGLVDRLRYQLLEHEDE